MFGALGACLPEKGASGPVVGWLGRGPIDVVVDVGPRGRGPRMFLPPWRAVVDATCILFSRWARWIVGSLWFAFGREVSGAACSMFGGGSRGSRAVPIGVGF